MQFVEEDLRIIIELCELDHKVTDLLGPRMQKVDAIQHRYQVSTVGAKANVFLQEMLKLAAQEAAAQEADPTEE